MLHKLSRFNTVKHADFILGSGKKLSCKARYFHCPASLESHKAARPNHLAICITKCPAKYAQFAYSQQCTVMMQSSDPVERYTEEKTLLAQHDQHITNNMFSIQLFQQVTRMFNLLLVSPRCLWGSGPFAIDRHIESILFRTSAIIAKLLSLFMFCRYTHITRPLLSICGHVGTDNVSCQQCGQSFQRLTGLFAVNAPTVCLFCCLSIFLTHGSANTCATIFFRMIGSPLWNGRAT